MSEGDYPEAGTFCWLVLSTTEPDAAASFYQHLFGWHFDRRLVYTTNGLVGSAVDKNAHPGTRDQPPNWLPFVRVTELDRIVGRATELGGRIFIEARNSSISRLAVIQSPTGEIVGLWESPHANGRPTFTAAGVTSWFELVTPEPDPAVRFYEQLFGWQFTNEGAYTVLTCGSTPMGGVVKLEGDWEDHAFLAAIGEARGEKWDIPPHRMAFFRVADCDAIIQRGEALGGTVSVRTEPLHTFGQFAVLKDPQGAYVSLFSPS
jgi:predicted enzyme related to lactoylglutathione lyase